MTKRLFKKFSRCLYSNLCTATDPIIVNVTRTFSEPLSNIVSVSHLRSVSVMGTILVDPMETLQIHQQNWNDM